MFLSATPEIQIQTNDKKIRELSQKVETLNSEIDEFFSSIGVTLEEISSFVNNREAFSKEDWEGIQENKRVLKQKLALALEQAQSPTKTKQAYQDLRAAQNWLPM